MNSFDDESFSLKPNLYKFWSKWLAVSEHE